MPNVGDKSQTWEGFGELKDKVYKGDATLHNSICVAVFIVCVSAVLAEIDIKIHLDNKNKSYKTAEALGEDFKTKSRQKSAF